MSEELAKGNFVTDLDPESLLEGKQGIVSRVYPNGTVSVRFLAATVPESYFGWGEEPHDIFISYSGEETKYLRKDEEWNPRNIPIVNQENVMQIIDELLDFSFWPAGISTNVVYSAQTDDSDGKPDYGWLMAQCSVDGDLHFLVSSKRGYPDKIRFRTYGGGGVHLGVRNAGLVLAYAMMKDMEKRGQPEGEDPVQTFGGIPTAELESHWRGGEIFVYFGSGAIKKATVESFQATGSGSLRVTTTEFLEPRAEDSRVTWEATGDECQFVEIGLSLPVYDFPPGSLVAVDEMKGIVYELQPPPAKTTSDNRHVHGQPIF